MGDVVSLVEKAAEAVEADEAALLERKLRSASFDFNDFLMQFKMMRKMGPLENILGMLPGMSSVSRDCGIDEKRLKRTEAIVLSMTSEERTRPDILNARRRQRIARGSGSTVTEVNDLLRRFDQMRKMMKNTGKMKRKPAQMARMRK
jgi:signal recognition particle subunit SRP54